MSLSDAKVRNVKPKAKPYKINDGEGLYLLVAPTGTKCWRFKYFFVGKERLLAFGTYPEVSLDNARTLRAEARKAVAAGNDPGMHKKESKRLAAMAIENSFERVAREWHDRCKHEWVPSYSTRMLARLETHVFPKLGARPVASVTAPEVLGILRIIEARGTLETARIVKQMCGEIFMYAIATGRAERNPVPDLKGALKAPVRKHHAYLKPDEMPEFLARFQDHQDSPMMKLAMRFLLFTFVRSIELRGAKWTEINIDAAEWRIPAERMKMKDEHLVPLSRQAIEVLLQLKKLTGHWIYLFPKPKKPSEFMTENAILDLLERMGYHKKATAHGFRATASTILNENSFPSDVIERQLAHCERNKVRAAYNHAQYLPERRKMMQWWADHLDQLEKKKPQ